MGFPEGARELVVPAVTLSTHFCPSLPTPGVQVEAGLSPLHERPLAQGFWLGFARHGHHGD